MNTKTIMADRHNLFLYINEMPIAHWFMEQFGQELLDMYEAAGGKNESIS